MWRLAWASPNTCGLTPAAEARCGDLGRETCDVALVSRHLALHALLACVHLSSDAIVVNVHLSSPALIVNVHLSSHALIVNVHLSSDVIVVAVHLSCYIVIVNAKLSSNLVILSPFWFKLGVWLRFGIRCHADLREDARREDDRAGRGRLGHKLQRGS